jgi:molybdopterin molybdotransferase
MRTMISTEEAKDIIDYTVKPLNAASKPLEHAVGLVLAADIYAMADIPAYPQSSMDGYAFSFSDWDTNELLTIDGEMAAGSDHLLQMRPQTAMRIFTGAPVPAGADTVVMQEKAKAEHGKLIIEDKSLQQGANVRPKGSEIKVGELALSKGTHLSSAAVGFLAGLGITEVLVYPFPSVTIIVTGNELQQPGNPLRYGQVYESNSFALRTALKMLHIEAVTVRQVHDDPEALTQTLQTALSESDVVLLTGGISVGDYDFVLAAAAQCGVDPLFHKIKQRPGKPLFFGRQKEKLVFGLPGNPSSVLTCFYLYVVPALGQLRNRNLTLRSLEVPLAKPFRKAAGLIHYLKGFFNGQTALPLDAQESYRMRSFAQANCLIQVREEVEECSEGFIVTIHLLPL